MKIEICSFLLRENMDELSALHDEFDIVQRTLTYLEDSDYELEIRGTTILDSEA